MKIGILGAGEVGRAVAKAALAVGHEVLLSHSGAPAELAPIIKSLGPGSSAATRAQASRCDLVVLATPWTKVAAALKGLDLDGRILVDATNPFVQLKPHAVLDELGDLSASELVAGYAPGAKVVKAFNSLPMTRFEAGPREGKAERVLFVSGDDVEAKTVVRTLIESFGFAVIDLGDLRHGGRLQQAGGPLAGRDLLLSRRDPRPPRKR